MFDGEFGKLFENTKKCSEKFGKVDEQEYDPYSGGAGPSEDQTHRNNLALQKVLAKEGIETKLIQHPEFEEPIEVLEIKPGTYVGYDRWGFVGEPEDVPFILDQGDLEDAIKWVKANL